MQTEDRLAAIQHEYDEWAKEGTDLDGFALYVGPEDVKWMIERLGLLTRTLQQIEACIPHAAACGHYSEGPDCACTCGQLEVWLGVVVALYPDQFPALAHKYELGPKGPRNWPGRWQFPQAALRGE